MTPILFEATERTFTTNGIGRLSDCISCTVTEERNGIFEVEFQYPITGAFYSEISAGRIIVTSHDENGDLQPFIIYRRSAPINGVVTFNAHHISYLLTGITVSPFTASSVADAFNSIGTHSMITNPFTFWTDNTTGGTLTVKVPMSTRALLGGTRGSILDVFGGEYKFDGLIVRNYARRGTDSGVTIRYGKNLTDLKQTVDTDGLYDAVVPYWTNSDDTVVYGGVVAATGHTATRVSALNLTQDFADQPTVAQLEEKALTVINSKQPWIPKENIKVNFIALWQTEEYKNIAMLERVKLCDTVTVIYEALGVTATAKVIKVVWNALLERYDSIELGEAQSNFADTIVGELQDQTEALLSGVPTTSMMTAAINHATDLITGGLGGHIVFMYDANGKPTDMLVMDTDDVNTAVHVLRINVNGIGFSSTGVSGTYTSAWTLDGAFVADWITAGHLSCNRIQGGTLTLGGSGNGNGVIVVYDASGNEIGRWDNTGLTATGQLTLYKTINKTSGGNTYKHEASCFVGQQRTVARMPLGAASPYQRNNTLGLVIQDRATRTNYDKFHYYRAMTMDGTWASDTIFSYGAVSRAMLATSSNALDASVLNASTSLSNLLSYVPGYVEMVESIDAGIQPEYSLAVVGYGSEGSYDYSGIGAEIHIGDTFYGWFKAWMLNFTNNALDIRSNGAGTAYIRYNYNSSGYWAIKGTNQTGNIAVQGSSAKRYKHDITDDISEELDPHKLYELTMKQFVFNDDCESWEYPDLKGKTLPGFIAEDVEEIYPSAAIHNNDGDIENWDVRRIVPGMLKLIQEQHDEIESLKERLAKLENVVEKLTNDMR